jgi:hypothetical protein
MISISLRQATLSFNQITGSIILKELFNPKKVIVKVKEKEEADLTSIGSNSINKDKSI